MSCYLGNKINQRIKSSEKKKFIQIYFTPLLTKWSSPVVQWVKDLALSPWPLGSLLFHPWPQNFHLPRVWPTFFLICKYPDSLHHQTFPEDSVWRRVCARSHFSEFECHCYFSGARGLGF